MLSTLKGASSSWPPCGNAAGHHYAAMLWWKWNCLERVGGVCAPWCSHHESPQGHIEVLLLSCVVHAVWLTTLQFESLKPKGKCIWAILKHLELTHLLTWEGRNESQRQAFSSPAYWPFYPHGYLQAYGQTKCIVYLVRHDRHVNLVCMPYSLS